MKKDLEEIITGTLMQIGISKGKIILEFGCGSGTYTIPVAKIVNSKGIVYALEEDKKALDELMQKAESERLENIIRVHTSRGAKIPLDDNSIDIVLLYDVFHDYYFPSPADRRKLLADIYMILKQDGFLSVWPKHMESGAKKEIENANFYLVSKHNENLIHDNVDVEKGEILKFRKRNKVIGDRERK